MRLNAIAIAIAAATGCHWTAPSEVLPAAERRCDRSPPQTDCFLRVPEGSWLKGAQSDDPAGPGFDPAATPDEGPVVQAHVDSFWIQRTEATVGSFRACVRDGACQEADVLLGDGFATYYDAQAERDLAADRMPINGVSWDGAVRLCTWLGGRLPTEAEWEFAARGTDGRRWPWGDVEECPTLPRTDPFSMLTSDRSTDCAEEGPRPFPDVPARSAFGLVAMGGNLWEWTLDPFVPADGATPPTGPAVRAQRGGSWMSAAPVDVRATVRAGVPPQARLPDVGVRCVVGQPVR